MGLQVAGVVHEASSVPTINTGTRKDVPTYHVLRKEDGEMCTRMDLQVRTASEISIPILIGPFCSTTFYTTSSPILSVRSPSRPSPTSHGNTTPTPTPN